ncbi:helix-turn-helix transcriptional regulator [Streptococcus suis]|nr:helix-turn-helix transcriptional regulator [Streptococcus suis]
MTQKELAELLEVTKSTIAGWEYANINPPEAIHKLQKMYDDAKDRIVDDGIDVIEKLRYIRHRLGVSYDKLAQLLGTRHDTTVKGWMDGAKPQMKYMAEINRMYYGLKKQHKPKPQNRRPTFCQLDPLDKTSWKAEITNPVIAWK